MNMDDADPDNPARPPAGVRLCAVSEIEDPGAKGFHFRHELRLFNGFVLRRGDQVTGFVDWCPHVGWPLDVFEQYLTRDKKHLLCTGHGALFDMDGLCIAGPCEQERLVPWPVEVRDGEVFTA